MGAELLIEDDRQKAGPGPASGNDMEGRGRLADRLAVAATELLPYGLDHLPLPRDRLQGSGDVFAELTQARPAAALARARRIDHHAFSRQMLGKGRPDLGAL